MTKPKSNAGRPTKLTDEIMLKITSAVRAGNYMETAAVYAGVHKSTLYDWLKRGNAEIDYMLKNNKKAPRKSEAIYVEFTDALELAMAESEMKDVAVIMASRDYRAAAWHLEKRFPDRWGGKLTVDATMEHKGEVNHKHDVFVDIDQYAEVLRKEAERRASKEADPDES